MVNRPLTALRALSALSRNPDDLPQVFTIIDSLPGRSGHRMLERFRASPDGQALLASRPDLGAQLADRAALHALPEGTLGRVYAELMDRQGITPQGIIDASVKGRDPKRERSKDELFIRNRMRDTHDLWHTVTGYGMDLLGEAALLCFIFTQTGSPGIALVATLGALKAEAKERRIMVEGYRRGRRAAWLPAVPWETLLALPITEVRARLSIDAPPHYEPVTTASLRTRRRPSGAQARSARAA